MDAYIQGARSNNPAGGGHIFAAAAIGGADVQFLIATDCLDFMSIHLAVAAGGNAVAAVKIFLSDSYMPNGSNEQDETLAIVPGNWVEITSECVGIVAITGASAQNQMVIPQRTGTAGRIKATWLKVLVAHTSGAGTLDGWYHGSRL